MKSTVRCKIKFVILQPEIEFYSEKMYLLLSRLRDKSSTWHKIQISARLVAGRLFFLVFGLRTDRESISRAANTEIA